MRTLVIGGTRSGKSRVAEGLLPDGSAVTYVATGSASDEEMHERIRRHRARRPDRWSTVEGTDVEAAVIAAEGPVLVDSLGLWVTGRMDAEGLWEAGDLGLLVSEAVRWFTAGAAPLVVVVEDVGGGVVSVDRGTRRWVDAMGEVTAALSALADRVLLVVAGRTVELPAPVAAPTTQDGPARPAAQDPAVGPAATGGPAPASSAPAPSAPASSAPASSAPAPSAPEPTDGALAQHGDTMVPEGALDLAVNVLSDRPARHVLQAVERADEATYPDQTPALVAVSSLTGLTVDHVVLLAGAAEAFWLLPHALRPSRAAVVHPYFTAADAALRACDVPVTRVPRDAADGWRLRPDRVPVDADLVVVGNPNNPTGTLDDPGDIASLCRPGRTVVVDEAFMDFVSDGRSSLAGRVDLPGLVVLRSVTKMWSVPGIRAGYLVAAPDLAARIRRHQQPWPVSSRAIAAIVAAADNEPWRTETAEGVARRRRAMVRRLERIEGVVVHEGAANFILLEVAAGPAVHRALLARGVAVRPSTFPLLPPRFLRVAVRDAQAVEQLAVALEAIV